MVWCPKYRKKIFEREEVKERVEQLIREISEEYGFEVVEMEVAIDHVHILLSFPPRYSIGEVVRIIKSITARQLFREYPNLKKKLWAGEMWEDGYFARTVGDRMTREVIEKYIAHHRKTTQGPAACRGELHAADLIQHTVGGRYLQMGKQIRLNLPCHGYGINCALNLAGCKRLFRKPEFTRRNNSCCFSYRKKMNVNS